MNHATAENFMVLETGSLTKDEVMTQIRRYIFGLVDAYNYEFAEVDEEEGSNPAEEVGVGSCIPKISVKQSALSRIAGTKAGTYGITFLFVTNTFLKVFKAMTNLKMENGEENTYGEVPIRFTPEQHHRNLIDEIREIEKEFSPVNLNSEFEKLPFEQQIELLEAKAVELNMSEYRRSACRVAKLFFASEKPEWMPSLTDDDGNRLNPNGLTFFLYAPFKVTLGLDAIMTDNDRVLEVTKKGTVRRYPMSVVSRQGSDLMVDPYGFVTEDIIKQVVAPFTFDGEARVTICNTGTIRFANVTFAWNRDAKHGNAEYAVLMTRQIDVYVPHTSDMITLTSKLSKVMERKPAHRPAESSAPSRRYPPQQKKYRPSTSSDGWNTSR